MIEQRGQILDSTTNTRDLGGMQTIDGRSIRRGMVFRSDAITAPTVQDVVVLKQLGLRHSVDFRAATEIARSGMNVLDAQVEQHLMPLLDMSTEALADAIQAVLRDGDATAAEVLLGGGEAARIALTGPLDMVRRTEPREAFAKALRILASADGAPLIFNCTAGKDRTGVFAAILQRLLGAPEPLVLADYELSNQYRAERNAATYQRLAAAGLDAALIRPLVEQSGASLTMMFRAIEEDHGTFDAFARAGLGLDEATVSALRGKLLR